MSGHEVDRVGCGHLGGDHQIAFVFAIFVIDENEHAAVAGVLDDVFNGGNVGCIVGHS